jgi:hypothetical protein
MLPNQKFYPRPYCDKECLEVLWWLKLLGEENNVEKGTGGVGFVVGEMSKLWKIRTVNNNIKINNHKAHIESNHIEKNMLT